LTKLLRVIPSGANKCRRGRSRGVEIRPDHAPGAIERIAQHCALLDMSEAEFRPILSMIGRLNRSLIGTRAEPADFAALRRVMAEIGRAHVCTPVTNAHL